MDQDAKKTTLRMIPYGLYVLTAVTDDSVGSGTINWMTQTSFDPPLLAMGVKADTRSLANIKAGGKLALSFLGEGQGDLAFAFFADPEIDGDAFVAKENRIPFERTEGGAIILTDAPAWAEIELRETVELGDHTVVVVEVTDAGVRTDDPQMLTLKDLGLNYGG